MENTEEGSFFVFAG